MSLFRPREARQWAPEPVVPPFPSAPGGGSAPSIDRAMQVSAVWACVRLLSDSVSMMPLSAYTMKGSVRVPTPPPPFLVSPSDDATMPEWIYMVMVSLMLRGNAYGHIVRRDSMGYPVQIELYNPDHVRCETDTSGRMSYKVNNVTDVPKSDMMHLRAFRMPGSRMGLSTIQYAARQINTDAAIADFAYGYFRDAPHPASLLLSPDKYTQEQARGIKDRFLEAASGREPAVLTGGMKYETISVSPEESQFLATQKYGAAEIARLFGVPPEMIASESGNSMTYANVEQRSIDYLVYTVQGWITRLEASLALLLPGQRHLRFDTSVLTRADYLTIMQATSIGIASKQMTVDEARARRDEPPLTDEQKAELALVPLDVTAAGKPRLLHPGAPNPNDTPAVPAPEGEPA